MAVFLFKNCEGRLENKNRLRDSFDYTLWRREYFDKMDLNQVSEEAFDYAKSHPHNGKGIRV